MTGKAEERELHFVGVPLAVVLASEGRGRKTSDDLSIPSCRGFCGGQHPQILNKSRNRTSDSQRDPEVVFGLAAEFGKAKSPLFLRKRCNFWALVPQASNKPLG